MTPHLVGRSRKAIVYRASGLLAAFILERDLQFRSIGESTILAQLDILRDNLGDTKVA